MLLTRHWQFQDTSNSDTWKKLLCHTALCNKYYSSINEVKFVLTEFYIPLVFCRIHLSFVGHSVCPYRYVDVDHPMCSVSLCFNYQCLLFRFACSFIFMQYSLSLEVHSILLLGLHSGHLFLTAALVLLFIFVPFFVVHMLVFCGIFLPIYLISFCNCSPARGIRIVHCWFKFSTLHVIIMCIFFCALSDSKCHAYVIA